MRITRSAFGTKKNIPYPPFSPIMLIFVLEISPRKKTLVVATAILNRSPHQTRQTPRSPSNPLLSSSEESDS
jgi:hypothetical protein